MSQACHPPVFFDRVLDDPALVRRLVEANAPYYPVQRYFNNSAEARTGNPNAQAMIIAPNFRGDWAYEEPLIEGVEPIFRHEGFCEGARRMFSRQCVEPLAVYANLTWQLPFDQGGGHTDVPEFRGISRSDYPIWLLQMMGHSGLFEDERVEIATAVAWYYEGGDGGFTYWPDGPDRAPRVHEGNIFNTAALGDNDRMYHRVRSVGRREDGLLMGMTLDTRLEKTGADDWAILSGEEDGEKTLASLRYEALRISISWKARIFRDEADAARYHEHREDLGIDDVFDRVYDDLAARGVSYTRSENPVSDPDLVDLLSGIYIQTPTVFEDRAA